MKNKKYYIKKNLISFIIGLIIFGGVGVYAAVTFPSNEVTYDNTDSGLSSTNVKGAIDELYTECTTVPAGDQILEDQPLEKDPYECRYFFTGANPNNYITFNNEKAGWRIISVECDGRIKIMRQNMIRDIEWDSSSNDWSRPAAINTYLNGTYYNGLNSMAKSQIVASNFSIGAVTWGNNDMSTQVSDENSNKWYGKVALPTVSEYIRTNSDKSNCGTLDTYNNNYYYSCRKKNWMYYSSNDWWLLSPYADTSSSVFFGDKSGYIGSHDYTGTGVSWAYAVRPTVYLSSEIKITGGNGSQSNPYTIE